MDMTYPRPHHAGELKSPQTPQQLRIRAAGELPYFSSLLSVVACVHDAIFSPHFFSRISDVRNRGFHPVFEIIPLPNYTYFNFLLIRSGNRLQKITLESRRISASRNPITAS
jgi:hypothetical protein